MPTIPWRRTIPPKPHTEYLVMASRLPLRSITKVPWFAGLTASVLRQLERTEGVVGYSLRAQPLAKTFWTLSAWTDTRALETFVRTMPHQAVMAKLRPHMGPTRFTTWQAPGSALPVPWDEAIERLMGSAATSGTGAL
jgi:quinol monooxygenase YgiN